MNRVLAAVDFSPTSDNALVWATELALAHGAAIRLVHSLRPAGRLAPHVVLKESSFDEAVEDQTRARLGELEVGLAARGLQASSELVLDTPSAGVVRVAESWKANLLVVGARGHSGLERLLLGSTAERVLSHAPCPVLVVHGDDAAPRDAVGAMGKVLVATDFSEVSLRAANVAVRLFPGVRGEVVVLHALRIPLDPIQFGEIAMPRSFKKELETAARSELDRWCAKLELGEWSLRTLVVEAQPSDAIVSTAAEERVDLIALGTAGRGGVGRFFLGSTARETLREASRPVLVMPPDAVGC